MNGSHLGAVDGTFYLEMEPSDRYHQIQVTGRQDSDGARNVPATGLVTITSRSPGAPEYEAFTSNTIDVTDATKWIYTIDALYSNSFKIVVSSLEAAHTLDFTMVGRK